MDDDDLDADAFDGVEALEELNAADFDDEFSLEARTRAQSGVRVFNLFSKRQFDYTYLAAGSSTAVTIRRALKVPQYYYYWVGMRIHNRDIQSGTFTLRLFQTLPSAHDPQEFSAVSPSMSVTCSSAAGDAPPALKVITGNNLGPYFKVQLNAAQGTGTAPIRFYAELSAVLYARPA